MHQLTDDGDYRRNRKSTNPRTLVNRLAGFGFGRRWTDSAVAERVVMSMFMAAIPPAREPRALQPAPYVPPPVLVEEEEEFELPELPPVPVIPDDKKEAHSKRGVVPQRRKVYLIWF